MAGTVHMSYKLEVTDEEIEQAVGLLRAGKLVAFPTETVYGLGADASKVSAIRAVFTAKQRPADHPLIVHLADMAAMEHWTNVVPREAWRLAEVFWPGPLTLVLPRAMHVPGELTGGQSTIALRVPSHPTALRLLNAFNGAIVAPSANRFGRLSPTTAADVHEELGDAVDLILDGGQCAIGIESTIVAFRNNRPVVLRPGAVTAEQIEDTLQSEIVVPTQSSPRVPGTLASHYAPRTPLKVVTADEMEGFLRRESANGPVAVLAQRSLPHGTRAALWQVAPQSPVEYARLLYGLLRRMDDAGCQLIVVESVPDLPEWVAIRDRIMRASAAGVDLADAATGT
jgi:L-threonylcarbamoyladenylate synthase